jgi:methyl-accepting chemotaxis protein
MEEMTATVPQNAENSRQANRIAGSTRATVRSLIVGPASAEWH